MLSTMKAIKPEIKIDVFLNKTDAVLSEIVKDKLDTLVAELIQSLGIPATAEIVITSSATDLISLNIENIDCHFPEDIIERIYTYVQKNNTPLRKSILLTKQGFARNSEAVLNEEEREIAAQMYSLFALEILKLYPSRLLGLPQFQSFWNTLKIKQEFKKLEATHLERLHRCFQEVLNMRISLLNTSEVSSLINTFSLIEADNIDQLQEALIETLVADKVVIEIDRHYFKSLTTIQPSESGPGLFSLLRDDMFFELGLHVPGFVLDFSTGIPAGNFRFRINHISSPPYSGIEVDEYIVDATIDRMKQLNIEGTPIVHPSNGLECSIISKEDMAIVEKELIKNWDALGYMVLCQKAALQDAASCFVTNKFIRQQLDRLARGWPQMVETLRNEIDFEIITQTFRALIREHISIRDFRSIIEAILEQDYVVTDAIKYMVLDERLPLMQNTDPKTVESTIKFIRKRIKYTLLNRYAWGAINLHVYQLGPKTTQILKNSKLKNEAVSADQASEILNALKKVVNEHQKKHPYAVILTFNALSSILKKLIGQTFPRLQIITFSELLPKTQIITLAHLS